jgi:putative transposase
MNSHDPEGVLPEAQRRLLLLGDCATAEYDYHRLKARAAETYVPLKVLWTWLQAYQRHGLAGLTPTDWTPWTDQPITTQLVISQRLAWLAELVHARTIPEECHLDTYVSTLAKQHQWSLRTAERWVRRYQVGGWWGLAKEHDPAKAHRLPQDQHKDQHKDQHRPALGTLDASALEMTFHRRACLGNLATQAKVSRAEVEAQANKVGMAPSTLWRYLKAYRHAGLSGLTPKARSDKHGHHRITPHMAEIIRGVRFSQVDMSVRSVYQTVQKIAQALGEPAPSEWQVRQICAQLPQPEVLLADGRDEAFRNRYEVTMRMEHIRRESSLILYQIDHTPVDVLVKDLRSQAYRTKSGEVRPWLTLCIDSRSRLVMAAIFGYDRPDRYAVAAAIRDAILTSEAKPYGGKPHEIWVDHGQELLSHHIHQLTQALHIVLHPCTPHRPQEKGIVERFFSTLNTRLWANQPGYVASNTQERNPHARATLTLAQLEHLFWHFIRQYHQEVHSETQETPLAYWDTHCYAEPADPRDLDLLLKEPTTRVIAKDGISYRTRLYWHSTLSVLVGKQVQIRAEPIYRAPDEIEVFLDHQWMCTATATDVHTLTHQEISVAKRAQKEHLRQSIKKAREAAHAAVEEMTAMTAFQHPPSQQRATTSQTPAPHAPHAPYQRPPAAHRTSASPPHGDFLERMAAHEQIREQTHRKQEEP